MGAPVVQATWFCSEAPGDSIRSLLATYYCRSVQATFRSEAGGWLHALSDHFSAVLGRLLNTNFS